MPNDLPSSLALDRIIQVFDPVPDWIRLILTREQQIQLARITLDLQATRLKAELDATQKAMQLIK